MTVRPVFSDEIQPAGYSDLIKQQSSEVGFNEALKRTHTTHAYPLSSISGASGGFVSLSDKHPWPCRLLPTSVLQSSFTERPDWEQEEDKMYVSLCCCVFVSSRSKI